MGFISIYNSYYSNTLITLIMAEYYLNRNAFSCVKEFIKNTINTRSLLLLISVLTLFLRGAN
jgi:hypothetical protein